MAESREPEILASLSMPTPGYKELDAALASLNALARRLLTDLRAMRPENLDRLVKLTCDAVDWWDWTDEGRAAYYREVDEFVALFPPQGD